MQILFITGTRADVGKLSPYIYAAEEVNHSKINIIITGLHMVKKFGETYKEVKKKFSNAKIFKFQNQIEKENLALSLQITIKKFNELISSIKPVLIVVHGDRIEALAGSIVGSFNNIRVCHVEGGDLSGTIDESIRHSITKLSHIHFPHDSKAKKILLRLGEVKNSIFIGGSHINWLNEQKLLPSFLDFKKRYKFDFNDFAISLIHPVTTEIEYMKVWVDKYFKTLIKSNLNYLILYPNSDPGSQIIIDKIDDIKKQKIKRFRIIPTIRHEFFLTALKNAKFIIGNSSTGIFEAPIFKTHVIDVGTRQKNRVKSYKNYINTNYEPKNIFSAIKNHKKMTHNDKNNIFNKYNPYNVFKNFLIKKKYLKVSIQKTFSS